MAWVTVRNEEENYLYTYLRSGTGTTGEYPPVLPVPRVLTIIVNLPEILRENSLPVLPGFPRYHRSMTGTTSSTTGTTARTVYCKDEFCGKKNLPVLPDFHRYHRSRSVLPVNHRYHR
jgi:hypothetical protein